MATVSTLYITLVRPVQVATIPFQPELAALEGVDLIALGAANSRHKLLVIVCPERKGAFGEGPDTSPCVKNLPIFASLPIKLVPMFCMHDNIVLLVVFGVESSYGVLCVFAAILKDR